MIGQIKSENTSLILDILHIESYAYHNLGAIAPTKGTKDGAKLAVGYFEECRDIIKVVGFSCTT